MRRRYARCPTCEAIVELPHREHPIPGLESRHAPVYPMWADNIAPDPVYVTSEKQYAQECVKRGKVCLGLTKRQD